MDGQGHLQQYEGGYTDYLEAKKRRAAEAQEGSGRDESFGKTGLSKGAKAGKEEGQEKKSSSDWRQNRPVKLKFTYKEQKEFETIEEEIARLEAVLEELEAQMAANATDSGRLNELMREKEQAESRLEEKMNRWVYLTELDQKIREQNS